MRAGTGTFQAWLVRGFRAMSILPIVDRLFFAYQLDMEGGNFL